MTVAEFVAKYEKPGVPVILTGLASRWVAVSGSRTKSTRCSDKIAMDNLPLGKAWTKETLTEALPNARLLCGGFPYRLGDFFSYQRQVTAAAEGRGEGLDPDDQTLYLFDHRFQDVAPALRGGDGRDWACPKYFIGGDRDLFSLLGAQRPRHSWIIAGCKRSGSNWHQDPNATSAWNAVVSLPTAVVCAIYTHKDDWTGPR